MLIQTLGLPFNLSMFDYIAYLIGIPFKLYFHSICISFNNKLTKSLIDPSLFIGIFIIYPFSLMSSIVLNGSLITNYSGLRAVVSIHNLNDWPSEK